MIESKNSKTYDLEERTFEFAKNIRDLLRQLPRTSSIIEDSKQLIRSSGSVAANYIEANESLSKKDFLMRAKICRKEAKESKLWLRLLADEPQTAAFSQKVENLTSEADELTRIFGSIVRKSE